MAVTMGEKKACAVFFTEIMNSDGWQIFRRIIEERADGIRQGCMISEHDRPRDRGKWSGLIEVLNEPSELIKLLKTRDTETP